MVDAYKFGKDLAKYVFNTCKGDLSCIMKYGSTEAMLSLAADLAKKNGVEINLNDNKVLEDLKTNFGYDEDYDKYMTLVNMNELKKLIEESGLGKAEVKVVDEDHATLHVELQKAEITSLSYEGDLTVKVGGNTEVTVYTMSSYHATESDYVEIKVKRESDGVEKEFDFECSTVDVYKKNKNKVGIDIDFNFDCY